jgi:glycosyltransferase involved in cell wall biosynthesis
MPVLCLVFRKPVKHFFSIERVFNQLDGKFGEDIMAGKAYLPDYSSSLGNIFRNLLYVRKQKADIFHITGDVHYAVLALPARRTMLTIHDCVFIHRPRGIKRSLLKWLFLDWPVRHCRWITTISEATRQDILKNTRCPPEKIVVIPNPVDDRIRHIPALFNASRPAILFIGSTPNKNLERVIAALEGISCTLNIIGRINPAQISLLDQYRIEYANRYELSDEELARQYIEADLVLFPSTFEGFGLPVVEAQKTGRPVITSNIDPMKEVAGGAACLVDPYDTASIRAGVLSVIGDKTYREQLVEKGLLNAARFAPAEIGRRYQAYYKKLLSE